MCSCLLAEGGAASGDRLQGNSHELRAQVCWSAEPRKASDPAQQLLLPGVWDIIRVVSPGDLTAPVCLWPANSPGAPALLTWYSLQSIFRA